MHRNRCNDTCRATIEHNINNNNNGSIYTGSVLLMEAIMRRRADVVEYLVANASQLCLNLNSKDKTGSNILFYAASVGGVGDLHKLIQAGCLVESDYEGRTVLMQAALSGRVDTARYLVLSSADIGLEVGQKDSMGRNALFYGVESNSVEMVKYLISTGITCHPTDENSTVLMQSAKSGNDVMTRFLLEHSGHLNIGDINTADFRGETALFYAVQSCSISVVALLIRYGADPLSENADGVSAISFAMNNAPPCIAVAILENFAPMKLERCDDNDANIQHGTTTSTATIDNSTFKVESPSIKASTSANCLCREETEEEINKKGDEKNGEENEKSDVMCSEYLAEIPSNDTSQCSENLTSSSSCNNKTVCCYDSDVSSRCSSSSGVCSRSTCSLYNSCNKSNSSKDELCDCNDELNNNNNNTIDNKPSHGNDTLKYNNVVSCDFCSCRKCSKKDVFLKCPSTLAGCSDFQRVENKTSISGVQNEAKLSDQSQPQNLFLCCTSAFKSPGDECDVSIKKDFNCVQNLDTSASFEKKLEALSKMLTSKDTRSRSLLQYLIEVGETKSVMHHLKAIECDEELLKKMRIEVDETGCTLLMSACKQPLEDSANSTTKSKQHRTSSSTTNNSPTTSAERLDLIKYLIDVIKVDPDKIDVNNRNALFYAVESGSLLATSYLLQKIRNVDADKTGRSILMVAVVTGNQLIVSEILASKFASNLLLSRDEKDRTAFHFCAMQDCSVQSAVMLDTLLKYEEGLRKEKHFCIKKNVDKCPDDDQLQSLRQKETNFPDSVDSDGRTPLMYACQSGNRSAVMRLLRNSQIQPERKDSKGRTALHHCFTGSNSSLFCAGSLLKRNVDVNTADVDGVTCLMLACQTCSVTNIPIIRMLVEFGADPVIQDVQGRDSFDYCPPIDSHYVRALLKDKTCMPVSEREALWCMEQRLSEGIHMNSVLRGLLKEGVFTKTLNFEVMKQPPQERVQKLIEILLTRGRTSFRKFCRVLRHEGELCTAFELMRMAYVKETEIFW